MRTIEGCPYREDVREEGGREWAGCGLIRELTGVDERGLGRVVRAACAACCAAPEAPSPETLNPVVASLLFTAAHAITARGGVAGCDARKAGLLKSRALLHLPRAGHDASVPSRNDGPCFHLGGHVGETECPTCAGRVRLKLYQCHHPLHDRVTLAQCRGCRDFDPRLGRGRVMTWSVGVTTAPRTPATLGRCLASLAAAGWAEPRLFAEPGAAVPDEFARLPITRRDLALGEWPNWFLGLAELVHRDPKADVYLMVEDDTVFSRGVRAFLEADLWPGHRVGLVSVYCPEPYTRTEPGWHEVRSEGGVIGSLAFAFPNAAARLLLADPEVVNHRRRGERRGLVDTDGVVGRWAARVGLPVHYHSPSLAQHVGDASTVWPGAPNAGQRHSANFAGEDFDARALIRGAAPLIAGAAAGPNGHGPHSPPPIRNVFACLVHEDPECVIDLVRNLRHLDPASTVLCYNGSTDPDWLGRVLPPSLPGVVLHPSPRPMRWGRLHDFAIDCMRHALANFPFDTLTIVDSDQLAVRPDYSSSLADVLARRPGVGLFSNLPARQGPESAVEPARCAHAEADRWRPFLRRFPCGESKFVHWSFWPSTVFTAAAARALVRLFDEDAEFRSLLDASKLWATEEVLLPTLVALLGFTVEANPFSYDYVKFRTHYSVPQVEAALDRPDVFWVHPIPRRYDDPLRRLIRDRFAGYNRTARAPAESAIASPR